MSYIFVIIIFISSSLAQNFEEEAKILVKDLKNSLTTSLTEKIKKDGAIQAIPFCHENVKSIAKGAAKERISQFEFGRTSHKIRNPSNAPQDWIKPYLEKFKHKMKGEITESSISFSLNDGKRVYMEPLFVEAKCLLCHGENVTKEVSIKVLELYPQDNARGFKLGEFRGFIWVKEK